MQIKQHLVTTSDERTWKFDRPVLFLGEWCRHYDRSAIWMSMDAEVAVPFGLQAEKKSNDNKYVQALSAKLLIELTVALNSFHNTNCTPRYWNILLGHWLQRYVAVCFNRYFTIEQALKSYRIVSTTALDSADYSLATPDSLSFILACNNDVWNNVLYVRVLQHMSVKDIELEVIDVKNEESFKQKLSFAVSNYFSIKPLIKAGAYYILPRFSRNNDAFIINSYLPKWQEIKLQLALGQCPQLWRSPPLNASSSDIKMRRKLIINSEGETSFERFVRDLLPDLIPTCYLEGYGQLNQQVEALPWPTKPKFIFTSNSFDTDEIFKAWAANKVDRGISYFVGQHGNYQAYPALFQSPEIQSSDKFFTWGWSNDNIKNIPAFVFKIATQQREAKPDGGLLLIELFVPHRLSLGDTYYEFGIYQEQQFRFVEALPRKIQNELTVRLHGGWHNMRWSDDKRWNDRVPSVHVETGKAPIQTLIARSRLVVHSYDSTGILEGLASNIPTLCFWDGGLDHLLPSAKPYYELLRGAGILADSSEQAAQLVELHWDNIDDWWKSEQVKNARRLFCDQFARIEKHPVRTMKRLLTIK